MASFSAFVMMGLFPNPGQDLYFITVPLFKGIDIKNSVSGKVARIRKTGSGSFVKSVKLDGEVYRRSWVGHGFFKEGGLLEIEAGETEGEWGTKEEDLPPSPGAAIAAMNGVDRGL